MAAAILGVAAVVGLVGAWASGVPGVPAAPAVAAPASQSTTNTGVIVVVDFSNPAVGGGPVQEGCDPAAAASTTGAQAMAAAGFSVTTVSSLSGFFACQIDGQPTGQSCTSTPTGAYWSYWHADQGQTTWTYSQYGAGSAHPPPGSVDAWTFGNGNANGTGQPSVPPSAVLSQTPGPTPTAIPTTTVPPTTAVPPPTGVPLTVPSTTSPVPPPGGGTSPTTVPQGIVTPSTTEPVATTTTAPETTTTTIPAVPTAPIDPTNHEPGSPRIVAAAPVAARTHAGSPVPLIVGGLVVLVLAVAGAAVAWRRRQVPRDGADPPGPDGPAGPGG